MHRFATPLLDRLFDEDASSPVDPLIRGLSVEQLKACVARDIESLLNTRSRMDSLTSSERPPYPAVLSSILNFGIADFSGQNMLGVADRGAVCRSIQLAIERHEPRLKQVQVILRDVAGGRPEINFSVSAVLQLSSDATAVQFDAFLQPANQKYVVGASRGSTWAGEGVNHG